MSLLLHAVQDRKPPAGCRGSFHPSLHSCGQMCIYYREVCCPHCQAVPSPTAVAVDRDFLSAQKAAARLSGLDHLILIINSAFPGEEPLLLNTLPACPKAGGGGGRHPYHLQDGLWVSFHGCLCALGVGAVTWPVPKWSHQDTPVFTDESRPASAATAAFLNPFLTPGFI